jgi:ribonuclease HI
MEKWNERGVQVQFWRIPREWNSVADSRAKQGAEESVQIGFTDPKGLLV